MKHRKTRTWATSRLFLSDAPPPTPRGGAFCSRLLRALFFLHFSEQKSSKMKRRFQRRRARDSQRTSLFFQSGRSVQKSRQAKLSVFSSAQPTGCSHCKPRVCFAPLFPSPRKASGKRKVFGLIRPQTVFSEFSPWVLAFFSLHSKTLRARGENHRSACTFFIARPSKFFSAALNFAACAPLRWRFVVLGAKLASLRKTFFAVGRAGAVFVF